MAWPKSLMWDGALVWQSLPEVPGEFYTGGVIEAAEPKARVQRVRKEGEGGTTKGEEPETDGKPEIWVQEAGDHEEEEKSEKGVQQLPRTDIAIIWDFYKIYPWLKGVRLHQESPRKRSRQVNVCLSSLLCTEAGDRLYGSPPEAVAFEDWVISAHCRHHGCSHPPTRKTVKHPQFHGNQLIC